MTEIEYIRATNSVKVSLALHAISDVHAGDDYGISEEERLDITTRLSQAQEKLLAAIKVTEGG
jgi:hypothetical protein